jgi:hypothetical protein
MLFEDTGRALEASESDPSAGGEKDLSRQTTLVPLCPLSSGSKLRNGPELPNVFPSPLPPIQLAEASDYEDASLLIQKYWLTEGHEKHPACRSTVLSTKPATRFIRIDEAPLRLCTTTEQEDCSVFATLSHCLGGLEFLRLLKENISLLMAEIPQESLSKTFLDAIEIARGFGVGYASQRDYGLPPRQSTESVPQTRSGMVSVCWLNE